MNAISILRTVCMVGCITPLTSIAQTPQWSKHYGEPDRSLNNGFALTHGEPGYIYGVGGMEAPELDMDGNLAIASGSQGVLVVKWDTSGVVQWVRTAGGPIPFETEYAINAKYNPLLGHLIVTGFFTGGEAQFGAHTIVGSGDFPQADAFIAAYDVDGECLWAKAITGYYSGAPAAIRTDASSNIWAVGNAGVAGANFVAQQTIWVPQGGYMAHYAPNGDLLDAERVLVNGSIAGMTLAGNDRIFSGFADANASLFGTSILHSGTNAEGFVAKVSASGQIGWITLLPSPGGSQIWRSEVDAQGNTLVMGTFVDTLFLPVDTLIGDVELENFFVASLNPSGEIQWVRSMHMPLYGSITDLEVTLNGDVYIQGGYPQILHVGPYVLPARTSRDAFVARFAASGDLLGAWNFGKVSYSQSSILPFESGFYYSATYDSTMMIGSMVIPSNYDAAGPNAGGDILLAKFGALAGFTSVPAMKADVYDRLHIYANPNNGTCTIELPASIAPGSDLVLTIHDATGRVVQRVPLYWSHGTLQVDIRAQARGIYHAELIDGQQRYSGKIVFE